MSVHPTIVRIKKRWSVLLWLKIISIAIPPSVGILLVFPQLQSWFAGSMFTLLMLGLSWLLIRNQFPDLSIIFAELNRQWSNLEWSSELLERDQEINLQSLQQRKLLDEIGQTRQFTYPIRWNLAIFLAALSLIVIAATVWGKNQIPKETNLVPLLEQKNDTLISTRADSVHLKVLQIQFTPPSYTQLTPQKPNTPDLTVPENSEVRWYADFEGKPQSVWLKFTSGDSLSFQKTEGTWRCRYLAHQQELYTINFQDESGSFVQSPYYRLAIIPDNPPEITVSDVPSFQRIPFVEDIDLDVRAEFQDDYGLTDAFVVATVTKGSGESVKFREEQLRFDDEISGLRQKSTIRLNTSDLGMEPGNELYFYIAAVDNRESSPQLSKTETFFFILEDTSEVEFSLEGNLGVDIMPDYFRSQLQLIIDTKKLIDNQANLPREEFNYESNALGFDQKQLRLKYGQFIGEEEDSGLEIDQEEPEPAALGPDGENILEEFGHDTDHENEEGQLMDKGTWKVDDHHHEPAIDPGSETEEDPLAAFIHDHEDEETNTFLFQSIKDKLRAALNEMWDSELYLRLYRPEESLPYQYKALELLNEIKNHARIYVQRIGFDPPPIKEDGSRLTRENDKPNADPFLSETESVAQYPAIAELINVLSEIIASEDTLNRMETLFHEAGKELAVEAVRNPEEYLEELRVIKILSQKKTFTAADFKVMDQLLTNLNGLFSNRYSVGVPDRYSGTLEDTFVQKLSEKNLK